MHVVEHLASNTRSNSLLLMSRQTLCNNAARSILPTGAFAAESDHVVPNRSEVADLRTIDIYSNTQRRSEQLEAHQMSEPASPPRAASPTPARHHH